MHLISTMPDGTGFLSARTIKGTGGTYVQCQCGWMDLSVLVEDGETPEQSLARYEAESREMARKLERRSYLARVVLHKLEAERKSATLERNLLLAELDRDQADLEVTLHIESSHD